MSEKTPQRRKCAYEKALRLLVKQNQDFIKWLDAEMQKPSTHDRGKRVAQSLNALEMAVDSVRFSTLGVDYRKEPKS